MVRLMDGTKLSHTLLGDAEGECATARGGADGSEKCLRDDDMADGRKK